MQNKSLVQLRGIAQSYDIPDIFAKDAKQLEQAISLKQQAAIPAPKVEVPKPEYDARLMTKPPSRKSSRNEIEKLLQPYVDRGLRLSFDENEERWLISFGKKTDEGTVRMPLRVVLKCVDKVMS